MTPEARYQEVVRAFLGRPEVSQDGRGFGASALKRGGRIFAMLSSRRQFVVKLPRGRVDELVAGGAGERFDTGGGRVMKEWLALAPDSPLDWIELAEAALAYASSR